MALLDSFTILVLAALLFLLFPLLSWWTAGGVRQPALAWWGAGSVTGALAVVLVVLRPVAPQWAGYHLSNTCFMGCLILWTQALRTLQHRPWSLTVIVCCWCAAAAYFTGLFAYLEQPMLVVAVRTVVGALSVLVAWHALQVARQLGSHNAAWLVAVFLMMGIAIWISALPALEPQLDASLFARTWRATLLAVTVFVTAVTSHLCMVGIVLEQSNALERQARLAREDLHETAVLDAHLRQLDREGRTALLTGALAHELNQPLTAALTYAEVVRRGLARAAVAPEAAFAGAGEAMRKALAATRRAAAVLERLRSASTVSGSTAALREVDLRQVLADTLELFESEWAALGVTVERPGTGERTPCRADPVALSQVLSNILRNATQAATQARDKRIQVRWETRAHQVLLTVRDHGPGFDAQILERLGEPFVSSRQDGMGIGLAISRNIILQHRGQLAISNAMDGGAEVRITLPLATSP